MAPLSFHPGAIEDVDQSIFWYDAEKPGLGAEFDDEVESAYLKIQQHPHGWPF